MKPDDKIKALCDTLKSNGYDLADEYDIIYGLQKMGYRRTDATKLSKKIASCNTKKVESTIDTGMQYWYYQRHGVGPGSIPRDVQCLKILDAAPKPGDYFLSDKLLTTQELREYEIKEEVPEGYQNGTIDSANIIDDGEDIIEAADSAWDKDFLDDQYYRAEVDESGYGPDRENYLEKDTQTILVDISDTVSVYDDGSWYWTWYENGTDPQWDEEYAYSEDPDFIIATQDDIEPIIDAILTPELPNVAGIYQVNCQIAIPVKIEDLSEDYEVIDETEAYIDDDAVELKWVEVKRVGDIT